MRKLTSISLLLVAGWIAACGEQVAPTASQEARELVAAASPTHGLDLTCFAGPCEEAAGTVNIAMTAQPVAGAAPGFGIAPLGAYNVHGAPPNTTYLVERAFDPILDGVCTAPFVPWPIIPGQPLVEPLVRLTTSAGGAGAVHVRIEVPFVPEGAQFDGVFRLIEESPNPGGTELRTECVRVTVK